MPRQAHLIEFCVAGVVLASTTVALLMWATRLEVQAAHGATRLAELQQQQTALMGSVTELQRRTGEDGALRAAVVRRLEDLQARYPTRLGPTLKAACTARPGGVWMTRLYWTGAEVKVEGRAWGDGPTRRYAERLTRSPYFAQVFAAPAGSGDAGAGPGPDRFLLFARAVARP